MSVMRVIVLYSRTKFEVRGPFRSEYIADFGHGINLIGDFDLLWGHG